MKRQNVILGVLLALQVSVIAVRSFAGFGGHERAAAHGLLLPGLGADGLTQIEVSSGGAVGGGDKVTVSKKDGAWSVVEQQGYPADGAKVDSTVRDLAGLEIADVVSTSGKHLVDLQVDDKQYERKVVLAGPTPVTLYFGTSGRASSVHVRKAGDDKVYAVRDYATWKLSARPDAWIDRTYFDANRQQVERVTLRNPKGELRLERDGPQDWVMVVGNDRRPADGDAVDAFLGKVTHVTMSELAGTQDKVPLPGVPVAELTLVLNPTPLPAPAPAAPGGAPEAAPAPAPAAAAPITRTLRLAPKPGATDTFLMHHDDARYVASASKWSVSDLLEMDASKLEPKAPPAVAAEPEGEEGAAP